MPSTVDPYRARRPDRAPVVIDTRAIGVRTPILCWAIGTAALMLFSQRVEIVCQRAPGVANTCEAHAAHFAWTSGPVRVDLDQVQRAELDEGDGTSRVVLTTKRGVVPLTASSESGLRDEKLAMIHAVNGFLSDETRTRVEAAYGSRFVSQRGLFYGLTVIAAFLAYLTRRVRVVVDRDAGAVRVVRPRFPLGTREEAFDLDAVSRAEVQESTGGDETKYRVVLLLAEGDEVPLTAGYSGGRLPKEQTALAINEALARDG